MRTRLILLIGLLAVSMLASSVDASEWVEVTIFSGTKTEYYVTDYFDCNHTDWRIQWEYTPEDASFVVNTYQQNHVIDSITEGAKVEATLSWSLNLDTSASAPADNYLIILVDGNITNFAEFPVYNVTLTLMFEPKYHGGALTPTLTYAQNETVDDIGTLAANETKQIKEAYIYRVSFEYLSDSSDFSYDIKWNQNEDTKGVSYIYDQEGIFYMEIITDAEDYTLVIEQDVESIPEFTAFTLVITLVVISMAIGFIIRVTKSTSETVSLTSH